MPANKPVPRRLSEEWAKQVRETGCWYEPPFWREASYQSESPWSPDELEAAADAVRRVYPADVARKLFRNRKTGALVWSIVADFCMPSFSPFLSFGFDASAAEPWCHGGLLKRLREAREHDGARFELEILAAFRRSTIPVLVEPLGGASGGRSPDFRIDLGHPVFVEAKLARRSEKVKEENSWFERLTLAQGFIEGLPLRVPLPYRIELTEKFERLQSTEEGRRWIRANLRRLEGLVRDAFETLQLRGVPNAVVVEELAHVEVLAKDGKTGSHHRGVSTDAEREAVRIVSGCVTEAANQFPNGEHGIVLVRALLDTSASLLFDEATRWFAEEGGDYAETVGVVMVVDDFSSAATTPLSRIVPVWRAGTAGPWLDPTLWACFEWNLNWREVCILDWRQRRGA